MINKKYALLILILIASTGVAMYAMLSMLTPYVSFRQAMASANHVQVMGSIDRSRPIKQREGLLYFFIFNNEGTRMRVAYKGQQPPQFFRAEKAVVFGIYNIQKQLFEANKILVKCPSKYMRE
jgi:cytochrome c-type biogenesis protein CcmE